MALPARRPAREASTYCSRALSPGLTTGTPPLSMTSQTDLAALLCSRLCHDLLSPVGAIGNGFELLAEEDDPELRSGCLDLIEQSARTSAVKLQYYRFAYGSPAGLGESVPLAEPRALVEALVADGGKVELDWMIAESALPVPAVKILLGLAAIGAGALVRGGILTLGADASEIVVRAAGERIAFDPMVGRALEGTLEEGELTAHTAPAQFLRLIAAQEGGQVQYALSDEALVMGALLPARTASA